MSTNDPRANKFDPFLKGSEIRKGLHDAEMPSYDELIGWIQRLPITMLPGVLARCVTICVLKKVFKPDGIETFLMRAIQVANIEHPELRSDE